MLIFKQIYNCLSNEPENLDSKLTDDNFIWLMFHAESKLFNGNLAPHDITRFIRLCCNINYENILSDQNNKKAHKNNLPEILQIRSTALSKTILSFQKNGLIQISDNTIHISRDYCVKGKLSEADKNQKSAICFYSNTFKTIYNQVNPSQHKIIGKALSLIPYMNTRNNIICKNTKTNDYDKCDPFTQSELMQIIGIDYAHSSRFLKDINQICFMDMPLLIKHKSQRNKNYEFLLNPNICCWSNKQKQIILREVQFTQ